MVYALVLSRAGIECQHATGSLEVLDMKLMTIILPSCLEVTRIVQFSAKSELRETEMKDLDRPFRITVAILCTRCHASQKVSTAYSTEICAK